MRKLLPLLTLFLLILFCCFSTSCQPDENDPDTGTGGPDPVDSTKAEITFQTYYESIDSGTVDNVLVGIGNNEANVNSGIFQQSGYTNSLGKIKFENLAPNVWYYKAAKSIDGVVYVDDGEVHVEGGDDVLRRIVLD